MAPKAIYYCSGGGSGFGNCAEAAKDGRLKLDIVAMVYNVQGCGAVDVAKKHGIESYYFPKSQRTPGMHEHVMRKLAGKGECFHFLSGCLWEVEMKDGPDDPNPGLDPRFVVNIHPAKLSILKPDGKPLLGGYGKHGDVVHQEVLRRRHANSGPSMHFVTKEYDEGPIIFEYDLPVIYPQWEALKKGVNALEHYFQPYVTNMVAHKLIRWDGKNKSSLVVPSKYRFLPTPKMVAM